MKIKKLEIQGFKSFVDKTEMKFPNGIITVVGPNGCGKSNVVDAIRWAMGEQSAKHLRGKLMEDIIFNGSEERKPVGMAEVSLTFDNGDGNAPADYANYSEITVSRRLHRSGESEYYINKTPCRLKDITELFMDTGVGTKAYSIVEQGKIGAIVTMKPEERRALIEEAAGITKYKSKKTAAMRKVDATQQNLLRVKDVIREVRRQINSLERQAKKAQKYKELREELKKLEVSISALRYGQLQSLLEGEIKNLNASVNEESSISAAIASNDKNLEESRLDAAKAEEELRLEQDKVYKASNSIIEHEQKISYNERETERIEGEENQYNEEISRLRARLVALSEKVETSNSELNELSGQEAEEAEKLKTMEEAFSALSANYNEKEKAQESAKKELVHVITMKSNIQNSIIHLNERIADLERRLEKKKVEKDEANRLLGEAKTRLNDFQSKLDRLYAERLSLDGSKSAELEKLGGLREEAGEKEEVLKTLQQHIQRSESKLHSLKELKNRYEGVQTGVQAIMQRHKESPLTDGVIGIVADLLDVPAGFEQAVGAVLDQKLQYVVVKNRKQGIDAVQYLKSHSVGRGTFIANDSAITVNSGASATAWKGGGTPLIAKVTIKDDYEKVMSALLDSVLLVNSIDEGLRELDAGFKGTIVTSDGDVIDPWGSVTGGKGEGGSYDLLKREREIKEIEADLKAKTKEMKAAETAIEKLLAEIGTSEKGLDELKQQEYSKDIEIANLEKDKVSSAQEVEREKGNTEVIAMEEGQLQTEIKEFKNELLDSQENLDRYGKKEISKEKEIELAMTEIASLRNELDEARQKVTESRITGESFKEKRMALERELHSVQSAKDETLRMLERDERSLSEGKDRLKELQGELNSSKENLENLLKQNQELKTGLDAKKNNYEVIAGKIREMESKLKDLHRSFEETSRKTSHLKISVTEKEMEIKHLIEGLIEKHNVDLTIDAGKIALPEDGDEERLQMLTRQIQDMGEVNLTALDEHQENLERLTFLEEQEGDLLEAIESLKKTISTINRTSRKRFKETFEAVNTKFSELFPGLFRGGKAKLILTDEEDLLETGVDIMAQPPGKKLQSINLLSGGEKALTAITLIFAMFLVKPSPFCLLDEVDAPLDDANVGRFNNLVKEMSRVSQIVMITHNKHSIEIGDTLYGVTMEDPGVSKFVSVKLN